MFLETSTMERVIFCEMKEERKVFWVKIIARLILFKNGTNTLILYFLIYCAQYGAECSAESGAKQYFILIARI